ncbi:MAG: hypothetical protein BWY09_01606 [Candidatus Hydrogenedentes bacterium ADurb.Bin179]|nr:MAG: hypothetical protein BWY09_01606 [Candidatus Hydrogenedentes bacterium ADurb.Bin179]
MMHGMVRRARTIISGFVHHIAHYSMDGRDVLTNTDDFKTYLDYLEKFSKKQGLSLWAYCLLPDHIRLVAVPRDAGTLAAAVRDTHAAYAGYANWRGLTSGRVWKNRFSSCVVDDMFVWSAVRLVESLPARLGLVKKAEKYPWSSAAPHCGLRQDPVLTTSFPPPGVIENWSAWLAGAESESALEKRLLLNTRTGHPFGSMVFIEDLERQTGRILRPQKRGPKPRA